jgi:hypothetical protein
MKCSTRLWNLLCSIAFTLIFVVAPTRGACTEMTFFDFSGYSYLSGPPAAIGTVLTVASKFNTIQPNPVWPLELLDKEYTVMIQDLTVATVASYGPYQTITYSGGNIQVRADVARNGTWGSNPPNSSVPSTFLDGDSDLVGIFTEMTLFFNTVSGTGTVSGLVNWQGGAHYGGMTNPIGWTVFGGVSNHYGLGIPMGYDLAWDPQMYGPEVPNPIERRSWGALKSSFHR